MTSQSIRFDGRVIAPGQSFIPFVDNPTYEVVYLGVTGEVVQMADCCGLFTRPVLSLTGSES